MKRSALLLAGCGLLALTGGEFSPGGVTFPMEQISAERYSVKKSDSPNLLGGDLKRWRSSVWIFGSKENKAKKAAAKKDYEIEQILL